MSINRTSILRGPAGIAFDSATIHAFGDIEVDFVTEYAPLAPTPWGEIRRPVVDRRIEVRFAPAMWSDLDKLFPYASTLPGADVFGATDKALVITPRSGAPLTLPCAAVTRMPSLELAKGRPMLGQMQFTAIRKNSADPAALASYLVQGAAATATLTGFDSTKIVCRSWTATWDGDDLPLADGARVEFDLGLSPIVTEVDGTVGMTFERLGMTTRLRPIGLTESDYVALLQFAAAMGTEPERFNLLLAGVGAGAPTISQTAAAVETGGFRWGMGDRLGELTFVSRRSVTDGLLDALFTFGTVS